ncbi:hypothetical protein D3C73_606980 [compost metagenome]
MQQRNQQVSCLKRCDPDIAMANRWLYPRSAVIGQQSGKDCPRLFPGQRPEQRQAKRIFRLPADIPAQPQRQCGGLELGSAQPLSQRSKYGIAGHGEPLRHGKGAVSFSFQAGQAIFSVMPGAVKLFPGGSHTGFQCRSGGYNLENRAGNRSLKRPVVPLASFRRNLRGIIERQ